MFDWQYTLVFGFSGSRLHPWFSGSTKPSIFSVLQHFLYAIYIKLCLEYACGYKELDWWVDWLIDWLKNLQKYTYRVIPSTQRVIAYTPHVVTYLLIPVNILGRAILSLHDLQCFHSKTTKRKWHHTVIKDGHKIYHVVIKPHTNCRLKLQLNKRHFRRLYLNRTNPVKTYKISKSAIKNLEF